MAHFFGYWLLAVTLASVAKSSSVTPLNSRGRNTSTLAGNEPAAGGVISSAEHGLPADRHAARMVYDMREMSLPYRSPAFTEE